MIVITSHSWYLCQDDHDEDSVTTDYWPRLRESWAECPGLPSLQSLTAQCSEPATRHGINQTKIRSHHGSRDRGDQMISWKWTQCWKLTESVDYQGHHYADCSDFSLYFINKYCFEAKYIPANFKVEALSLLLLSWANNQSHLILILLNTNIVVRS